MKDRLTRWFRQGLTLDRIRDALTPKRLVLRGGSTGTTTTLGYAERHTTRPYTREQILALVRRLPLWMAGVIVVAWTSPVGAIRIHGPSMLPTMMADETDIWCIVKYHWYHWFHWSPPTPRRGDLVGFGPPPASKTTTTTTPRWWWNNSNNSKHRISCKRVVGLPGDRVLRYGQYVHLYVAQDPIHRGVQWPEEEEGRRDNAWMNRNWDEKESLLSEPPVPPRQGTNSEDSSLQQQQQSLDAESRRTIVVPEGHVWLEADCPGLGLDSRQFGPVPIAWLQGRILGRIWPLWSRAGENNKRRQRPHPIPLDDESLRRYNVHRVPRAADNNNNSA